jgi:hypothetical protein
MRVWLEKQGNKKSIDELTEQEAMDIAVAKCFEQGEQKPADTYCQEHCKGYKETGKCFADEECKAKREAEQKTAWSEEDKNTIQVLKNIVRHSDEIDKNIYAMPLKEKLYDWLKSLKERMQYQPHWKPNEEQLEAVKRASNGSRAIAGDDYLIMESLYNDLKKLREE